MIILKSASITCLNTDAVVNAANEQLMEGGGVCGYIFAAAGPSELQAACDKLAPCKTGSAVITPAFGMKNNKYHSCGWADLEGRESPGSCKTLQRLSEIPGACQGKRLPIHRLPSAQRRHFRCAAGCGLEEGAASLSRILLRP